MGQKYNPEDFRMRIIPVEWLSKAKEEYLRFCQTADFSPEERKSYVGSRVLDLPELPFTPVSIIIIMARMSMKTAVFKRGGKIVTDLFRAREVSIDGYLNSLYAGKGYHLVNERNLPQKILAVCSGLGKYGKNNLVYEDEWGSFIQLETYISDVPYETGLIWRDIVNMDSCESCGVCMRLCPGGAIRKDRFLLELTRCHGWLDVTRQLPDSAPHTIAPCCVCQRNCPKNSGWRSNNETVEFSEEETELLMAVHEVPGEPFKLTFGNMSDTMRSWGYPEPLVAKVMKLGIYPWTLKDIPAKLEHMFSHTA
ncbi:MAG: 4Fe-4S binding protein [Clostridiales bacterium]|nr:4Fe-4S binding protein [Clostridiales bacterium]